MLSSDNSVEKPLYSSVVATPRSFYKENQFTFLSTNNDSTDCDSDHHSKDELDISSFRHLGSDKFKIDRRKLEKMIETSSNTVGVNNAEYFFKNIMDTTDTFITWQKNLKIGARTRKHPFVNIVGKPNDIAWAKGLILSKLATRGPLLKMKMNISDSTWSLKTIMDETETLIHFPDSNNPNLMAMYGTLDRLEQARVRLRSLTPLLMSFELPNGMQLSKYHIEYIKKLESFCDVKIIFMSLPKQSSFFAIVKGTEGSVDNLKEAVRLLVNATCGKTVDTVLLNIKVEVPRQLFELSMSAENSLTLIELMEKTSTIISIPSYSNDSNVKDLTPVIITGTMEGVCEAKKEIMSQLPIELTFDVQENPYYTAEILSLGMKYGISLTMKHNPKDNSETITMIAPEKIISHIYEANEEVMEMQQEICDNETEIPKAYFKALESDSFDSIHLSQYADISKKIWTPLELNNETCHQQGANNRASQCSDWTEVSNDSRHFYCES
ncbi:protein bicaudal C-like [Eupeodes corollae]|uniref:protein bicaudal C-like n=1 Tax=Eupeodes corollae TaxID=290404 RepID=UPI0024935DD4|nr:protein bicaudal C-like [Eupeodes corollae]